MVDIRLSRVSVIFEWRVLLVFDVMYNQIQKNVGVTILTDTKSISEQNKIFTVELCKKSLPCLKEMYTMGVLG